MSGFQQVVKAPPVPPQPSVGLSRSILLRWRYLPERGRDLRLDFLRGWCIFSMVVDHAAGERTSPLFHITGNGTWPMTGAHGFVMLSGTVMGMLYLALLRRDGVSSAMKKLGGRALKLYAVAVVLGLIEIGWGLLPFEGKFGTLNPADILGVVTLTHGSDDLMTFYLMLLALTPLLLFLFEKGLTLVTLAASVGIWLLHVHNEAWLNPPLQYFVPLADWQLLFVAGMAIGHQRERIRTFLVGRRRDIYLVVLFGLLAFFLSVQLSVAAGLWHDPPGWMDYVYAQAWQGYDHNPPLHMLALFCYLLSFFHVVDWFWVGFNKVIGWFFIPLGQAALYVYAVHTILVYYLLASLSGFQEAEGPVLTLSLLALMALLWLMVKRRFLFSVIPR